MHLHEDSNFINFTSAFSYQRKKIRAKIFGSSESQR